jgi:serine/threonine protein kinase/tetratricopeptide (TPR) repeat protein
VEVALSLTQGASVGRYRIDAMLGAGGMGEVYRARDARLERDVAIKVLPDAVAADADRLARFEREAKALARIEHPNILTIHEFGRDVSPGSTGRATYFAVTELLTGETLSARLARERLSWRRAVEIGAAVADGLAAAHGQGIVHRDLKPDNLFLTADGRVKILDFGLAKAHAAGAAGAAADVSASAAETGLSPAGATAPGSVLGTVGYMSPEQVQGTEVDGRADLFALGCVLYEMATGRRAFARPTPTETLAAILSTPVAEISASGTDAPPDLARIVTRCVEKQPAARFQSAADLAFALRALLTAPADVRGRDISRPHQVEQASIVVLPFDNLSPDPDNAFFADGLTEELIADLSKIQSLRVISRTSAMHYKGTTKPLPAIAHELHVRHVLEGSVRKAGNSLRITAQLIDATTDGHLWAEKYSGTMTDVFDLQERLSRRIVEALRLTLTPAEMRGLGERHMNNSAAYECYLRATYGADFWTPEGLARAEAHLTHGLEIIGEHPAILAGLAFVNVQYVNVGLASEDLLARALAYCDRALALDPRCPHAHAALGSIAALEGNAPKAVRHYERAVAGAPGDVTSIAWLCWLHMLCGRTASASPLVERLLHLDPVNPLVHLVRGVEAYFEGRFAQAADLGMVFYRMAPGQPMFVFWYALLLAYAGRGAEADDVLSALPVDAGDDVFARLGLMLRCTVSGDHHGFERLVTPRFEVVARRDAQDSWHVAAFLARLGQGERALGWLENAVLRGFAHAQFIETTDPFLESIRHDPRFRALVERARQVQASIEASPTVASRI